MNLTIDLEVPQDFIPHVEIERCKAKLLGVGVNLEQGSFGVYDPATQTVPITLQISPRWQHAEATPEELVDVVADALAS